MLCFPTKNSLPSPRSQIFSPIFILKFSNFTFYIYVYNPFVKFCEGVRCCSIFIFLAQNETRPPPCTIHQNKLKMDKRLKYKSRHHKSPKGKQAVKFQISHVAFLPIYLLGQRI